MEMYRNIYNAFDNSRSHTHTDLPTRIHPVSESVSPSSPHAVIGLSVDNVVVVDQPIRPRLGRRAISRHAHAHPALLTRLHAQPLQRLAHLQRPVDATQENGEYHHLHQNCEGKGAKEPPQPHRPRETEDTRRRDAHAHVGTHAGTGRGKLPADAVLNPTQHCVEGVREQDGHQQGQVGHDGVVGVMVGRQNVPDRLSGQHH
mmetsp:Transcript_35763/g.89035  ORF Transcript_35763/g.89035 Transcript_35763/m.89035 type:complete len:202 (+) Transcript_35763:1010-1615(+)